MKLDEIIKDKKLIGIAGHVRPDGDCAGSTLAVYNYIKDNYPDKDVRLYLEPIPNIFKFMKRADQIRSDYVDDDVFDLFIALDCGDLVSLVFFFIFFVNAISTLCIDHHASNSSFADVNYIFPDASSTCELVFELIDRTKLKKDIAECLYTGMVHDTGVFQFSCTAS